MRRNEPGTGMIGMPFSFAIPIIRYATALLLAAFVVICLFLYPLPPWPLAIGLLGYSGLLLYRPAWFLFAVPFAVPVLDGRLWTGWTMIGEADLFVATTVAVLLVRECPATRDFKLQGLPGAVVIGLSASWFISCLVGLLSPLGAPASDNVFLRPDNALRLAKALVEALVLLPFILRRQRTHGDAIATLGWGFATGMVAVTLIVVAERLLFGGLFDFSTDYRVAGPFSSMRVGGGHIGAYAAMVLPFSITLFRWRPRWQGETLAFLVCVCGGYTVTVTFARAAYAACAVAMVVAGLGWLWVANIHRVRAILAGIAPLVLVLAGLGITAAITGMHSRLEASAADFVTRQDNWRAGMAVRDRGILPGIFGMGLGTYQRAMEMRSQVNRPSDLVLKHDGAGPYLSIRVSSPFFLGQKISLPRSGSLHLTLSARSPDGSRFGVSVCDKVLLYSDNCRATEVILPEGGSWLPVQATFPSAALGGAALDGWLHRPVELSIYGQQGHTIEVRAIDLTDDDGHALLVNGNFARRLDRWLFTDDSHVSWRMLNEFLMLFFETGALGLLAYCMLAAVALIGASRAVRAGRLEGAAVAGSVMAFLISGMFDNVLEAPRPGMLFFLVCFCGLIQFQSASARPAA